MNKKTNKSVILLVVLMVSFSLPILAKSEPSSQYKYEYNLVENELFGYHITRYNGNNEVYEYEAVNFVSYFLYELSTSLFFNVYNLDTNDSIENNDFEAYEPINGSGDWSNWNKNGFEVYVTNETFVFYIPYILPSNFSLSDYWNENLTTMLRDKIIGTNFGEYSTFQNYIKGKLGERENNYNTDPDYINQVVMDNTINTMCENEYWDMFLYLGTTNFYIVNDDNTERGVFEFEIALQQCYNSENKLTYYETSFYSYYFAEPGSFDGENWIPSGPIIESTKEVIRMNERRYLVYDSKPTIYPYLEQLNAELNTNMKYNLKERDELFYNKIDTGIDLMNYVIVHNSELSQITQDQEQYTIKIIHDGSYLQNISNNNTQSYHITIVNKVDNEENYEFVSTTSFQLSGTTVNFKSCTSVRYIPYSEFIELQNNPSLYNVSVSFKDTQTYINNECRRLYFDKILYNENTVNMSVKSKTYDEYQLNQIYNYINWSNIEADSYYLENNFYSLTQFIYALPNDILVEDFNTEDWFGIFILHTTSFWSLNYVDIDPINKLIGSLNMDILESSNGNSSIDNDTRSLTKNIISDNNVEFKYEIFVDADNVTIDDNLMDMECNIIFELNTNYGERNIIDNLSMNITMDLKLFDAATDIFLSNMIQSNNIVETRMTPPTFNVTSEKMGLNLIANIDISEYDNINSIRIDWGDDSDLSSYNTILTNNSFLVVHQYDIEGNYTFTVKFYDNNDNAFAVYTSDNLEFNKLKLSLNVNFQTDHEIVYKIHNIYSIEYMKLEIVSIEIINTSIGKAVNVSYNIYNWNSENKTWDIMAGIQSSLIDEELKINNEPNNLLFMLSNITVDQLKFYIKMNWILYDHSINYINLNYDNFTISYNNGIVKLQTMIHYNSYDWGIFEASNQWNNDDLLTFYQEIEGSYCSNITEIPIEIKTTSGNNTFKYITGTQNEITFNIDAMNYTYEVKMNGTLIKNGSNEPILISTDLLEPDTYIFEITITDAFGRAKTEIITIEIIEEESSFPSWLIILIIGIVIVGIAGALQYINSKKSIVITGETFGDQFYKQYPEFLDA